MSEHIESSITVPDFSDRVKPKQIILSESDIERFWKYTSKATGNCWNWTGCKFTSGYGMLGIKSKLYLAHRLAWVIHNGDIPGSLCVLHKCDNRLCCNPEHLFLGTKGDNNSDCKRKGRSAKGDKNGSRQSPEKLKRGTQHPNAKLTEAQIIEIRARRGNGETYASIGRAYGVTAENVFVIAKRKYWKHVP